MRGGFYKHNLAQSLQGGETFKTMRKFKLKEGQDFIELNNLLKRLDLVNSGGEAKHIIKSGVVKVNGESETRVRNKILPGFKVEFNKKIIEVLKST